MTPLSSLIPSGAPSVPPVEERPFYVKHPSTVVSIVWLATEIIGFSMAFSGLCGPSSTEAKSELRKEKLECAWSLALIAPFGVALVTALALKKINSVYAAQFGQKPESLIVETGGD